MSFGLLLVLFLVVLIIYLVYIKKDIIHVKSTFDGNIYIIRRGEINNKKYLEESANTLALINKRIENLILHLQNKYKDNDNYKHIIQKLRENYNYNILSEAAIDNRYTTFTIDKKDMHICLRTRDDHQKLYDINLLMYVILHELAHLCNYNKNGNPIHGHGLEFKEIFQMLVKEAIYLGVYEYTDYEKSPKEYCGILITTQIV